MRKWGTGKHNYVHHNFHLATTKQDKLTSHWCQVTPLSLLPHWWQAHTDCHPSVPSPHNLMTHCLIDSKHTPPILKQHPTPATYIIMLTYISFGTQTSEVYSWPQTGFSRWHTPPKPPQTYRLDLWTALRSYMNVHDWSATKNTQVMV